MWLYRSGISEWFLIPEENNGDADVDSVHYAAAHGDVTILMDAIRKDPSLLEQQDSDGESNFYIC